jgi:hypothetical protein
MTGTLINQTELFAQQRAFAVTCYLFCARDWAKPVNCSPSPAWDRRLNG